MVSRSIIVLAVLAGLSSASTLTLLSPVPAGVSLKQSDGVVKGSQLSQFHSALLGLSSPATSSPVSVSPLAAPKAIVVVELSEVAVPHVFADGETLALTGAPDARWTQAVKAEADAVFDDYSVVSVAGGVVSGDDALAAAAKSGKADTSKLKSKGAAFAELEAALQLAEAIEENKERFEKQSGPAVFSVALPADAAVADVEYVVAQLAAAARAAFGADGVVVAVEQWEEAHVRAKRADDSNKPPVQKMREQLNVSVFSSGDFPAIFAIFAGLVLAIGLALIYIAVGLWTMDPGRDSIIYRMTTVRQKKD